MLAIQVWARFLAYTGAAFALLAVPLNLGLASFHARQVTRPDYIVEDADFGMDFRGEPGHSERNDIGLRVRPSLHVALSCCQLDGCSDGKSRDNNTEQAERS